MCAASPAVQRGRSAAGQGHRLLSLAHLSLIECAPARFMQIASEAGFDLVDLRLSPATPTDKVYSPDELAALCRQLRPIMTATGLRIWDVEIIRINDQTKPENYLLLMEAAAALGAQRMKLVCDSQDHGRVAQILESLCALAAPFNLTLDLEYMIFSGVKSLRAAVALVKSVARPDLRVLVDALHWVRAGDMGELRPVHPSLLGYVQLCDGPLEGPTERQALIQEARTSRLAPGDGEFPLDELLELMPPQCVASLEVPLPAGYEPVSHARRLFEAARLLCDRHQQGSAP